MVRAAESAVNELERSGPFDEKLVPPLQLAAVSLRRSQAILDQTLDYGRQNASSLLQSFAINNINVLHGLNIMDEKLSKVGLLTSQPDTEEAVQVFPSGKHPRDMVSLFRFHSARPCICCPRRQPSSFT